MATTDPFKLTRNTATLEAYRQHQRAIRAAAQPWLTVAFVALLAAGLGEGLCLRALSHNDNFRILSLLSSLLVLVFGLASAISGIRARRYIRSHPLELPEPPSAFGGD
jgi:hypothetical protein